MGNWTRQELLLAFNLYIETPFGKQHHRYPPIVNLAAKIERTPSAVAMKLNNFTSLDPSEKARGISGLTGASKLDRQIWSEFENDRQSLVLEIESLLGNEIGDNDSQLDYFNGRVESTDRETTVTSRRYQDFFRRVVLNSYEQCCCITGNPIPQLLRASHIVPWSASVENRLNPQNGICLVATFDAAFDKGLIAISDKYRLMVSSRIKDFSDNENVKNDFLKREGCEIRLPQKNLPDLEFLSWHRSEIANIS